MLLLEFRHRNMYRNNQFRGVELTLLTDKRDLILEGISELKYVYEDSEDTRPPNVFFHLTRVMINKHRFDIVVTPYDDLSSLAVFNIADGGTFTFRLLRIKEVKLYENDRRRSEEVAGEDEAGTRDHLVPTKLVTLSEPGAERSVDS